LGMAAGPVVAQDGGRLDLLKAEIERVAPISGGVLGVGIHHIETGREIFVGAGDHFPMASAVKVPLAVELLHQVDQGRIRLDSMITLQPSDLHPGSGTLTRLFNDPGVSLSIHNLLELMLLISDNAATDVLFRVVGGGEKVNARMAALGVRGVSADRPTLNLIADAVGITNLPPEGQWNPALFRTLPRPRTDEERKAAVDRFYADKRDTATPEGMTALLRKIFNGEALSPASTALLLDIMYRCETGDARIKGLLPPDVRVAHKTGTLGLGVAADVGIIALPNNGGHVVVSAFVKQSTRETPSQERAIAQAARAAYDFFLFNPGR
ncbi:MAG: class A beta-lactamase, partial [Gemmatimonadales bacterium]